MSCEQKLAMSNHVWIILFSALLLYFIWMDVALYYRLQSDSQSLLMTQSYDKLSGKADNKKTTGFDPFDPISVKLVTLDHLNHYVYYPLTGWLDEDILEISNKWTFITPDMISYSHILVALIASKFVYSESLLQKRFGVFLFEVRSFLDSYDGYVARVRAHQRGMVQVSGSWGYYLDGLCDLAGTTFFMIVILLIMKRKNLPKKIFKIPQVFFFKEAIQLQVSKSWFPLSKLAPKRNSMSSNEDIESLLHSTASPTPSQQTCAPISIAKGHIIIKQCWSIAFCMGLQQFISSVFWNRYMQNYHLLLEVPHMPISPVIKTFQLETLRSAPFWIIVWAWRLLNPHAHMSFLLGAIFFDKSLEIFTWIQYLQFVPLGALIMISEVHLQATSWNIPV